MRSLIYAAALLRSLGIGLLGVLLGVYLSREHFGPVEIGLTIGAGLAGAACATAVATLMRTTFGIRRILMALSFLSAFGGLGLAWYPRFPLLLPVAFFGMVNGMGTDRTASFVLEQAMLPAVVAKQARVATLSFYNLVVDAGHALGALAAVLPAVLADFAGLPLQSAYKFILFGYAALNIVAASVYLFLPESAELSIPPSRKAQQATLLPALRARLWIFAALGSMDSLGGGFLTDALMAYWFFHRFGVAERELGLVFFAVHILNAASYLVAARVAKRIGMLKTMVFTHLPSSLLLLAVPLARSFAVALVLFLLREALVEMDVPVRQAFLCGLLPQEHWKFATGVSNLCRNVSWAVSSSIAGAIMKVALSAPLVAGAALKIVYDLSLYRAFRKLDATAEFASHPEPAQS